MGTKIKEHDSNPLQRRIRSFVRREGRLTKGQQRALDGLWPSFGLNPETVLDPDEIFGRSARRTLEIGFGNGDALLKMAQLEPETDFIGIEVHRPGVGKLLLELEKNNLRNVRIFCTDAVSVINDCIPDWSLDRVLIFFPDPWHKQRHHKRRLVQEPFITSVAAKLKPGGTLHLATDWENYAEHMLKVVGNNTAFRNCAGHGNYSPRPDYRPLTKFEQRGLRLGHGVWDLVFDRL